MFESLFDLCRNLINLVEVLQSSADVVEEEQAREGKPGDGCDDEEEEDDDALEHIGGLKMSKADSQHIQLLRGHLDLRHLEGRHDLRKPTLVGFSG